MARCGRRRVSAHPASSLFCSPQVKLTVPEGKYKGRKPTAQARSAEIKALKADGVRPVEIARRLGIGRASVYRILDTRAV
jgi:DNA invertase Pin-like site-specific DNA recombinase